MESTVMLILMAFSAIISQELQFRSKKAHVFQPLDEFG